MNQYVTGSVIKELREKNHYTQSQLAEKLMVSDKAISKWETGKGYPDISLLEPIAKCFGVSVTELISGNTVSNVNVSANMLRSNFYVCPVCGNVIHATGEAVVQCHGVTLVPEEAQSCDCKMRDVNESYVNQASEESGMQNPKDSHLITVEKVEDEYFVTLNHAMEKDHYISFFAAVSSDRVQIVKLYPEGNAQARFKINGVRKIYCYCNRHGLYEINVHPGKAGRNFC